jgi:hypothetical protein
MGAIVAGIVAVMLGTLTYLKMCFIKKYDNL